MQIVVVGDGKVGSTLTEQLSKEGHSVVVIDKNIRALQNTSNALDVLGIEGNGATVAVQQEAGVDKADLLIAATSTDELNMLCCLVARKLGAKHTIARIRNPEYVQQLDLIKDDLGLSMTINPELAAAREISRILRFPSAIKVDFFAKGRVELVEVKLRPGSPLEGLPLHSLYNTYKCKVLVCAVQRDGQVFIPDGSCVLQAEDKINLTAPPAEVARFFKAAGITHTKIRNVMLIGGGRVAYYLARQLDTMNIDVKIIESDARRCQELCELLPRATIIHGDCSDHELLHEEGINQTDALVALTGFDEQNIILSVYANSCGVKKVITKVNRDAFLGMVGTVGLESVVSPKTITANQILRYVRALQNSVGSNVETLYKLVNNQVEALEFRIRENAAYLGTPLCDLPLRKNLLIACVVREGKIIIPRGSDCILAGDSVIVVTANKGLQDFNDIFQRG